MSELIANKLPAAPKWLVSGGNFNLGRFSTPFAEINPLEVKLGQPRFFKNMRLKEWQHFALVSADYYLSVALFNAKTLGMAQICVQDIRQNNIYFYERKLAPWSLKVPNNLADSWCCYEGGGFQLKFHNNLLNGRHDITFAVAASKRLPAASGSFTIYDETERYSPMEVCLPLEGRRALYSHKNISPLSGEITIGDKTSRLDKDNCYGLTDIHKGYYPYQMRWHWATAGKVENGKLYGFNLTNNQVRDQATYNENCLWADGCLHSLPPVVFELDPREIMKPWHITDSAGLVDLVFTPEVVRTVDINALIIANKYRGPFGTFAGRLTALDGFNLDLEHFRGMCEDFYLRC